MISDIEFAEIICARYSHDLAGPIGAINNGVEFLEYSEKDIKEKALELIKSSAKQAVARLQFFRQVFGFIKSDSEMSLSDIMQFANSFYSVGKIGLNWVYDENSESLSQFNARVAKLLFNLLFLTSMIIISSGEVEAKLLSNENFIITAKGEKIIIDDYSLNVLKGEMELVEVNTRNVHIYYLTKLLKELKMKLMIKQSEGQIIFTVNK